MNEIFCLTLILVTILLLIFLWRYQLHRQQRIQNKLAIQAERARRQQVIEMMMALMNNAASFAKVEFMAILAVTNFDYDAPDARQKLRLSAQRLHQFWNHTNPRFLKERTLTDSLATLVDYVCQEFSFTIDFAVSDGAAYKEPDYTDCYWRKWGIYQLAKALLLESASREHSEEIELHLGFFGDYVLLHYYDPTFESIQALEEKDRIIFALIYLTDATPLQHAEPGYSIQVPTNGRDSRQLNQA